MTERGAAAIELSLGIVVLLVPVALLVLSFGPTLERRALARSLAVEAGRSIVMSEGDIGEAIEGMVWRASFSGVAPGELRVTVCGAGPASVTDVSDHCALDRFEAVDVRVEVAVEPRLLPGGPATVAYTHHEPVDRYRSRP